MSDKEPRGYRRRRQMMQDPNPPLHQLHPGEALADSILGADKIGQITEAAAAMAPLPDPEDLLAIWAQQYYDGRGDIWVWQIGYYVAEDLRLRGLVTDRRPTSDS